MFGLTGIIAGILLMAFGIFGAFFFPTTEEHQPEPWAYMMMAVGVLCMIVGFFLVFF